MGAGGQDGGQVREPSIETDVHEGIGRNRKQEISGLLLPTKRIHAAPDSDMLACNNFLLNLSIILKYHLVTGKAKCKCLLIRCETCENSQATPYSEQNVAPSATMLRPFSGLTALILTMTGRCLRDCVILCPLS